MKNYIPTIGIIFAIKSLLAKLEEPDQKTPPWELARGTSKEVER